MVELQSTSETGEVVMKGLVAKVVFELLAIGHVADVEHQAVDRWIVAKIGEGRFGGAMGAVGATNDDLEVANPGRVGREG